MILAEKWVEVSCRITPILKDMNFGFVSVRIKVRLRCGTNLRLGYGWRFSARKAGFAREKYGFLTAYVLRLTSYVLKPRRWHGFC